MAGDNYGQGSSREHAAISPRYLGVKAVIAKSYARIHRKNLINFGILPLIFSNPKDYDWIRQEDIINVNNLDQITKEVTLTVTNKTQNKKFNVKLQCSSRELHS